MTCVELYGFLVICLNISERGIFYTYSINKDVFMILFFVFFKGAAIAGIVCGCVVLILTVIITVVMLRLAFSHLRLARISATNQR